MDIRKEYTWVTPNPEKVKRFIAICEAGRAKECYLGEIWFVHRSQLPLLFTLGFMECENNIKAFDTWQEAEEAPDVYKIVVR